jgi:type I restriction enzyme M protein
MIVGQKEWLMKEEMRKRFFHPALKDVKTNVGTALNKALHAVEDANADILSNVLKGIDFNIKKGKTSINDQRWIDLIKPLQWETALFDKREL